MAQKQWGQVSDRIL